MSPPSTAPNGRVRVPKTAEVVAAALRRQIARGEIPVGGALPSEAELMERFGVSRPSLREALRILESEMLITVRRGVHGGARASRPTVGMAANYLGLLMQMEGVTLADVYMARIALEPAAVAMLAGAADRASAVAELRAMLAEEAEAADDPVAYVAATTRFHQRLVELSGNQTLTLIWGTLQHVLVGEVQDSSVPPSGERLSARQQVISETLDLVAAGDVDGARELWRAALTGVSRSVLRRHGRKTVVDVLG